MAFKTIYKEEISKKKYLYFPLIKFLIHFENISILIHTDISQIILKFHNQFAEYTYTTWGRGELFLREKN